MAVFLWSFLAVVIPYMTVTGSKDAVRMLYQPATPWMCRDICLASTDAFNYIKEDSSCRRIPVNRSEDSRTFKKPDRILHSTALIDGKSGSETYDKNSKGGGLCSVLQKRTNVTREMKLRHCNPGINLHKVCNDGKLASVQNILSRKQEDINCRGHLGRTPVMVTARRRRVNVFIFLVRKGCDLTARDDYNDTVLHAACAGGSADIVRRLLCLDINNVEDKGRHRMTPLMLAVFHGNTKVVKVLITYGCDPKVISYANDNILHVACRGGHVDMVRYILSNGIVDIDSREGHGQTPVMTAAYCGYRSIFDLLVSEGCNLRLVDDANRNILHLVSRTGHIEMVKYVLSLNIYGLESRGWHGQTPVMMAIQKYQTDVVKFFVRKGSNMKAVDNDGNTVLHIACMGGRLDMLKYLTKLGAVGLEERNNFGKTPLQLAMSQRRKAVVAFLKHKSKVGKRFPQM